MNAHREKLAFTATLLAAVLGYWVGLSGPLMFDDSDNLAAVAAWYEGRTDWHSVVFGNASGLFGRPLSMLSFLVNVQLLGLGVWGLKLGNLVLHLLNGCLVFHFLGLLASGNRESPSGHPRSWLPWLGASLWLLHPMLASTVLYVVQRMAMLSALFTFLALIAYLHGRFAIRDGYRKKGIALLGIFVPLFTILAALSKESGVLIPPLCAILEWFVFQPDESRRRGLISKVFIFIAIGLPAALAVLLTSIRIPMIVGGYVNRPFTLSERLLTQPRVMLDYIYGLLLPNGPRLGIYHDDYVVSHSLAAPPSTAIALAGWIALLAIAWHLRRRVPGLALGLGIFLVGHALESSVFPLLMYFEHRNYLPAVGLIWAALSAADAAIHSLGKPLPNISRLSAIASVAFVAVAALATGARASVWASRHALLNQALIYHPDSRWLRQDLIAEAMGRQPPAYDEVREHADHLLKSTDESTRRIGAIERVLVDCASEAAPAAAAVQQLFDGRPEPIEPDLLALFKLLVARLSGAPCPGLSNTEAAARFSTFLDRSMLSDQNKELRVLRFESALLNDSANDAKGAIDQAKLAGDEPRVLILIATLLSKQGDRAAAVHLLDQASERAGDRDTVLQKDIAAARLRIESVDR
ncbi:MAG: hypothetical protein ABI411_06955 [Tahibacter sp.]